MQLKHVWVIFNPKGGSAKQRTLELLVSSLVARGINVNCAPTTAAPDSAKVLAAAAAKAGADVVVAFGGDGTARSVAEGLLGTNIPVAVFPGGTGNLFARNFYSVPTPAAFAQMLVDGKPQAIDLFQYECVTVDGTEEKGVFMVGLGFGPLSDAISESSARWKRIFGRLTYVGNVLRAACWPRPVTARVTVPNGDKIEGPVGAAFALNVCPPNAPFLSRGCSPSDGLMDVVVVRGKHAHQLFGCGMCLTAMRPERSKNYKRIRAAEVVINTVQPVTLNVDGDAGPTTREFRLSVLPGAVQMILA
jgi:diacylglycerol kinase family enzyme